MTPALVFVIYLSSSRLYTSIRRGIIVLLSVRGQSRASNAVIADGPRFFINIVQPTPTSIDSHKTDPQITSRGGVLFVYTPSLQPVMVIALNGKIVRNQKQIGLQGYEGLPFGTYVIRINEKTFKIQLSK